MTTAQNLQTTPLTAWLAREDRQRGVNFVEPGGTVTRWSHADLADATRRVAGALWAREVQPGDRVLITARSGPGFIASFFGCFLVGATPCPTAPPTTFQNAATYRAHLTNLAASAGPVLGIAQDDLVDVVAACLPTDGASAVALSTVLDADPLRQPALAPSTALVQFTSGSSGPPKATRISAPALEHNLEAITAAVRQSRDVATASWLPVHHDMGLVGCLLTSICVGSDLWLMHPETFLRSPETYLRCLEAGRARLSAMPTFGLRHIATRLADRRIPDLDLSQWQTLLVGAEPVDPEVLRAFERCLAPYGLPSTTITPAYGLAENTLAATFSAIDAPWQSRTLPDGRESVSCGQPLTGIGVQVADESGRPVHEGEVGEVVISGRCLADGYAGGGTDDGPVFSDGELHTGDAGTILDGELHVLGRWGDALKVRGRSVLAEEVEQMAARDGVHPSKVVALLGVRDGVNTAVVVLEGPARKHAEAVRARLRPLADDVLLELRLEDNGYIQRTTSGKPRRRVMWRQLLDSAQG